MENWKERFRNQFVDTYGEKDSKEWRIAYQPIEELEDFISQELDKAREEGRREGDIASDFLYWHPLGGGMPDSSIRIGVEFEVGGCYEDWWFVIEENGKPISSGRTLKEAIDKLKTKEDGK